MQSTPPISPEGDTPNAAGERMRRGPRLVPVTPFGRYTLVAKLGQGGTAEVFLASAEGMGGFKKLVVIKRLHPYLEDEPDFPCMFMDEARLAARLNHPQVVQTLEVGEVERSHFMAIEHLQGQSLDRVLARVNERGGCLPAELAVQIGLELLDGLHYAHELEDYDGKPIGIVHRDISPQNVFVTYNGVVKLLDFGIAKASTHVLRTRAGELKGKYAYMSPEQAQGLPVDRRTDLWAAGVLMWEALTGRRLFAGNNDVGTLQRVLHADIPLASEIDPSVPVELAARVARALRRDRNERYQTALEFREALEPLASAHSGGGRPALSALLAELFEEDIAIEKALVRRVMASAASHPSYDRGTTPVTVSAPVESLAAAGKRSPTWSVAVALFGLLVSSAAVWNAHASGEARGGATLDTRAVAVAHSGSDVRRDHGAAEPRALGESAREGSGAPSDSLRSGEGASSSTESNGALEGRIANEPRPGEELAPALGTEAAHEDSARPRVRRARTSHEPADVPSDVRDAPAGTGFLSFDSVPWSEVSVDGRLVGQTPLLRLELSSGRHTLALRNPETGAARQLVVTIEANQVTTRRITLE